MTPTWVEISLTALRRNYRTIQQYVSPNATVCAVVKADAYGHGSVPCACALEAEGATWFAVFSVEEGLTLRRGGIRGRILLLSGFWRGEEEEVIQNDLTPCVWEPWQVELLENAVARLKHSEPHKVPVHMKLNTGMNRLGTGLKDLPQFLETIKQAEHLVVEGVLTHLASSEVVDAPDVDCQLVRFNQACAAICAAGISPVYCHVANSAAMITRDKTWKNMVRPGLSLYGYYLPFTSSIDGQRDLSFELPVKPVLSWKTRILDLRDVEANQPLGYNGAYITRAPARIAVLPVGYSDGLNRHLSSRGRVIVRDDYAAIVGNVAMNVTLIDVTGIPGVSTGDEVTIIGKSESCCITASEHAAHASTISYEILCNISKRVPRKYVE